LSEDIRHFRDDAEYFACTLIGTTRGGVEFSVFSGFVGWADDACTREIREPSEVHPERVAKTWDLSGEPWMVVNSVGDLMKFLYSGGHALVDTVVARTYLSDAFQPEEYARSGPLGFRAVAGLPSGALNRAPSKKQRMQILKRDGYRCRICGRRSADYVDVELHVHHIRPWASGGLTEDENLITLCHTCHGGLEPHGDSSLFDLVPSEGEHPWLYYSRRRFREGMELYRQMVAKGYLPQI
jgi:hypothetical protein